MVLWHFKVQTSKWEGRKDAAAKCVSVLNDALEKEEQYRDVMLEQFEQRHETAGQSCEQLEEAIGLREDAY